jgi:hypothetical protein
MFLEVDRVEGLCKDKKTQFREHFSAKNVILLSPTASVVG